MPAEVTRELFVEVVIARDLGPAVRGGIDAVALAHLLRVKALCLEGAVGRGRARRVDKLDK